MFVLAYLPGLKGPFIYDDWISIEVNRAIEHLGDLWTVFSGGENNTLSGRPLLSLTMAANYAMHGLEPLGFRLVNLLLHLTAATWAMRLVRNLLLRRGWSETEATTLALVAASLWLLHPLATQTVTYIVQRGEALVAVMSLGYVSSLARSVEATRTRDVLTAWAWCLAAFASKESAAFLPIVGLAFDLCLGGRPIRELLRDRRRWLLHAGGFLAWLPLAFTILSTDGRTGTVGFGLPDTMSSWEYALHQVWVIPTYLRLFIWPDPLVLHYGPVVLPPTGVLIGCGLLLLALSSGIAWAVVRRSPWGFLGVWYVAFLLPSSSFVPINDVIFQHRPHTSNLAVAVAIAALLRLAWRRGGDAESSKRRVFFLVSGGAAALALAVVTGFRNNDYRSAVAIWTRTVEQRPQSPGAWLSLGRSLEKAGDVEQSVEAYRKVLSLKPRDRWALQCLGTIEMNAGRYASSEELFNRLLEIQPNSFEGCLNRGLVRVSAGRPAEGLIDLDRAILLRPENPTAWNNRAIAQAGLGRNQEALDDWRKALILKPDYGEAWINRGLMLWALGRREEGLRDLKRGVRVMPELHQRLPMDLAKQVSSRP